MRLIRSAACAAFAGLLTISSAFGFDVDTSPQPETHPPIGPELSEVVPVNPPAMIWRHDERAATYILELARNDSFETPELRIEGIDMPFYNHSEVLAPGQWYWRYFVIDQDGHRSRPGPVRTFIVPEDAVEFPVPPTRQILAAMPGHPRIFTTPDTLEAFRSRRHGTAESVWTSVRAQADAALRHKPTTPGDLVALEDKTPDWPTARGYGWKKGDLTRRVPFWLIDDKAYWSRNYDHLDLNNDAAKANALSFAYLISGEKRYAEAAREWLNALAPVRIDYHLPANARASHDTVYYSYEVGLKHVALTYDRIYHHLSPAERERILEHIRYHLTDAYEYIRNRVRIHLAYHNSHPQGLMQEMFPTVLAVANDLPEAEEWVDYIARQYVNRIAYLSADGGNSRGQSYGHSIRRTFESLVAMRTACGLDLFRIPRLRHVGQFWLYTMSLNYWYQHGGDVYSLLWPWGSPHDTVITNLVASMTDDPYVKWWSDTTYGNPEHIPFQYLSETGLEAVAPIDILQARVFPDTGQVAAYDGLYDHTSNRIFFRSSEWGGHNHAHADQNNFVIHAGGEILAADTGYYTYYGDTYHQQWSVTTNTHNSILINGQGQPKDETHNGRITRFIHSPAYTFFTGDASKAYDQPMERFERAILFIRPGAYVVYDELKASEPSEFTWLLNTFAPAEIDDRRQEMIVAQQHMRMKVDHVLPDDLSYEQSNERRYPIQTRDWSRYKTTFPEPWNIRVTNTTPREEQRFLALLHTYDQQAGATVTAEGTIDEEHTVGLRLAWESGEREVVLFRRHLNQAQRIAGAGVASDGAMAVLAVANGDTPTRWMAADATLVESAGRRYLSSTEPVDASGQFDVPGGAAMFRIKGEPQSIGLYLPAEPSRVMVAQAHDLDAAEPLAYGWTNGMLSLDWPGGEAVVWVDPTFDLHGELPDLTLAIQDGTGGYELSLPVRVAEDGRWVAYGRIAPREPGIYRLTSDDPDTELLIQDRWDISCGANGRESLEGVLREGTELFIFFDPQRPLPTLEASVRESWSGRLNNYLRNGDFEHGIPGYPPRGITIMHNPRDPDPGWPGWSKEDAVSGQASLKFIRPKSLMTARMQPLRLLSGGRYMLQFYARGNATEATVVVNGAENSGGRIKIEPSEDWQFYELALNMKPGFCEVRIQMNPGGDPDQVLWLDDMAFGPKR